MAGCAATSSTSTPLPPTPAPSLTPIETATPIATVAPTVAATVTPTVSPTPEPTPSAAPVDWNTELSLVDCPSPRTTAPACLDTKTSKVAPATTPAIAIGGELRITMTVRNAAPSASPAVTLVLFTFEPPMVPSFLAVVSCNAGCRIVPDKIGISDLLEWPGLTAGDHTLTATLKVIARPAQIVGPNYEYLAGLWARPATKVIGAEGIDTSTAFALATGGFTLKP
jgi:hypothetical protein